MQYVPVPYDLLEIGRTIPVDLWDRHGKLLLRRGHCLESEQHREMLVAHEAAMTEGDALAWTRGYERTLHQMLRDGSSTDEISRLTMPGEIPDSDFLEPQDDSSVGCLVLRDRLQGILYQPQSGTGVIGQLERLRHRCLELLTREPDRCLFVLFQALADPGLGYCATHALLSAVVCDLTAAKVGISGLQRRSLFRAALLMNIAMARAQDNLALQNGMPSDAQRTLIRDHPQLGADTLHGMGLDDEDALDIVRWHHEPESRSARADLLQPRLVLRVVDMFVAKMAARKTRLAMSPLGAARSMVLKASGAAPVLASAVATAVGFYPPGTYVQLVSAEKAVVVARGPRAHDAHVVSIVSPGGMPLSTYLYRDVRESRFAIRAPVNAEKIKVIVDVDKAHQALTQGGAR